MTKKKRKKRKRERVVRHPSLITLVDGNGENRGACKGLVERGAADLKIAGARVNFPAGGKKKRREVRLRGGQRACV